MFPPWHNGLSARKRDHPNSNLSRRLLRKCSATRSKKGYGDENGWSNADEKHSFGYSGALLWNSLPENIRAIRSIGQFKKEINCALVSFDSHSAIL